MESSIQKNKRPTVVVDFYLNSELGWLRKETEESEKTYFSLRELLKIRDSTALAKPKILAEQT